MRNRGSVRFLLVVAAALPVAACASHREESRYGGTYGDDRWAGNSRGDVGYSDDECYDEVRTTYEDRVDVSRDVVYEEPIYRDTRVSTTSVGNYATPQVVRQLDCPPGTENAGTVVSNGSVGVGAGVAVDTDRSVDGTVGGTVGSRDLDDEGLSDTDEFDRPVVKEPVERPLDERERPFDETDRPVTLEDRPLDRTPPVTTTPFDSTRPLDADRPLTTDRPGLVDEPVRDDVTLRAGTASWFDSVEGGVAQIHPLAGNDCRGTVRLVKVANGLRVTAELDGLEPNKRLGFHIHEFGDCSNPGDHFNPKGGQHGAPGSMASHLGDLGNLESDSQGRVRYDEVIEGLSLVNAEYSLLGRGLVIHSDEDDLSTQPSGGAGVPLACGVIAVANTKSIGR